MDSPPAMTLGKRAVLRGVGLHTGVEGRVTIVPRGEPGIVFVREDLPGEPRIRARVENLLGGRRRTILRQGHAEVHTAEHLLAAFYGLGIDRAEVRLRGPELPGLDGSSRLYVEAVREAGLVPVGQKRPTLRIEKAMAVAGDRSALVCVPGCEGLVVDYILDHDDVSVPVQRVSFCIEPDLFATEIAPARTFVLQQEAKALLAAGLGKGASTKNTLVVGPDGVRENELRFPDEFARHKVLDLLGDLCLLEAAVGGRVVGIRSGHSLNWELLRRIARGEGTACGPEDKGGR